jgi:uncharacterized surface protein with fasciclin (FAS1) repeats
MRRLVIFFLGTLWLLFAVAPTAAQGSNLAAIIDNRSELSTLSVFLDAAPEMRDLLESSASYTVFAPNDQAFDNLSSSLGIPLADLLRSPEIVEAIVAYHVIDGSYDSQALEGLSGQVIPTQLRGAFIGLRLNESDTLVVNNVVEVVTPDIRASNGRLHVINDVLLNRVIYRLVDDFNINLLITPNAPTATETPEPSPSPTEAVATPVLTATAAPRAVSYLRFANFAPQEGEIEIYINDTLFVSANFGLITDFQLLSPDIYELQIRVAGEEDALFEAFNVTLLDEDFKTIVLAGVDSLQYAVIEEDFSQIASDTARVLFYQAVEGLPNIAIRLDGKVYTGGIGFAGRTVLDIPAADYDPLITVSGEADSIILDPERLTLDADTYYLLGFVGTTDGVQWVQSAISSDELEDLRRGTTNLVEAITPSPSAESDDLQSIVDTLNAEGNFTILLEALEIADDEVINRLGSRLQEPVTLLAPTDQAFTNLFSSLGLTKGRVFANRRILSDILRYHVIEGEIFAEDFRASAGTSIPTLLQPNQAFYVTVDTDGNVFINGRIHFEKVDIQASNGVIHVIDDVLLPQSALDAFGL